MASRSEVTEKGFRKRPEETEKVFRKPIYNDELLEVIGLKIGWHTCGPERFATLQDITLMLQRTGISAFSQHFATTGF